MALQASSRSTTLRGSRVAFAARPAVRSVAARRSAVAVKAYLEYPDPELIESVKTEFPEKGIASIEEARALYAQGYVYLDVRPELEIGEVGRFKGSVNVPKMNMVKKYNAEKGEKEYVKSPNDKFVEMVKRKFPDPETFMMIGCSDGTSYTMDSLIALDEAGYFNIVGMKGGYYAWTRVFD